MVEILKFIRPEMAFDPESIQVLASALDDPGTELKNLAAGTLDLPTPAGCGK